jgi:hypothetical protein
MHLFLLFVSTQFQFVGITLGILIVEKKAKRKETLKTINSSYRQAH